MTTLCPSVLICKMRIIILSTSQTLVITKWESTVYRFEAKVVFLFKLCLRLLLINNSLSMCLNLQRNWQKASPFLCSNIFSSTTLFSRSTRSVGSGGSGNLGRGMVYLSSFQTKAQCMRSCPALQLGKSGLEWEAVRMARCHKVIHLAFRSGTSIGARGG